MVITVQADQSHALNIFPPSSREEKPPYPATSTDSKYPFEISHFNGEDILSAAYALLGIGPPDNETFHNNSKK
jgi:hypothetical protein